MKLPRRLRRHPDFTLATPDGWDQLAESEPAIPRLGPTMWYRPAGGRRTIALLHRPDTSELAVEERWHLRGQTYRRPVYLARDVYAAVDAAVDVANVAFTALFRAGYRLYADGAPMLSEAFGFRVAWLRGPLFSVKSSLAVIAYHEKRHAQEIAAEATELAFAEARGLVSVVAVKPSPRSRQSALAERGPQCLTS